MTSNDVPMKIEIRGGGFANKGAELMLRTVAARLRKRDPEARLAVEANVGSRYEQRAHLGLAHIYPSYTLFQGKLLSAMIRSNAVASLAFAATQLATPREADALLGLVNRRHCDALIDIAGYAYGDKYSWIKSRLAAEAAVNYAKRGKPVVFMPQMFGPFKKKKVADQFKRACDHASLIYAREQQSYDMVADLIGKDDRLRIVPDITIASFPPESPAVDEKESPYVCMVPNERMLDHGRQEWGDSYLKRLQAVVTRVTEAGLKVVLVVHTNDPGDAEMAHAIKEQYDGTGCVEVFSDPDPYVLKAFISKSRFLVGSRFHSIVASLSTGVPAIALGWAHKYEMLANDFGVPELLHRGADDQQHLLTLVDRLLDTAENDHFRDTLKSQGAKLRGQVETMWTDIDQLLSRARSSTK